MDRKLARELAEKLVAQMTLEEKAGQLRYDAPAIPRLGIPEYNWWNEVLHGLARCGTATSFPQAIGMAAMFDEELLEQIGDAISTEVRASYNALSSLGDRDIYKGLTVWSPNINIFRDPRWGRGHETYGEDPYLTAQLGAAFVRGLQGCGEHLKTAACAKHFCVHSGPEDLRHRFDAVASPKDMEETYLPAFRKLVESGVESVMGAYNRTNGEPCCGSKTLLKNLLREKWGFRGYIVSDCWAVRDFHEGHKVTRNPLESVKMALDAGCDLNCGCTYQRIMDAVNQGLVSEDQITEAAVHLFTTRYLLGIIGEGSEYDSISYSEIESPEHLALSHKASLESCVLLKNNGILPLNPDTCGTVGVIGPNANSRAALIGNYHGTSSRYITVLEGIQDLLGSSQRVFYSEGCSLNDDRVEFLARPNDRLSEAITVANNSDVVILVVGLDETLEGEEGDEGNNYISGDKKDLLLPESQRLLMDAVLNVGKPTVVVLMAGSSIDISEAEKRADGILLTWYPGARGGRAVAELLFGKASPSGKLPVTFYRNEALAEMPDFTDYSMRNRTYRYYQGTPLYRFGFGLTYGNCTVERFSLDNETKTVSATVKNSGPYGTGNVLKVYIHDPSSPFAPPNPVLCGFKRVYLSSGEEKTVSVPLGKNAFTVVNDKGERVPCSENLIVSVSFD